MPNMRDTNEQPRYIADCMLGRLSKWLRVLGYDVSYHRRIADDHLIARARREGRVLLTRDTRLVRRRAVSRGGIEHILIESDDPGSQLIQIVKEHGLRLRPSHFLSRCLRCNEPTAPVEREAVRDLVPSYVFSTQETFSRCPACTRVYWKATHVDSILSRLPADLRQDGEGDLEAV